MGIENLSVSVDIDAPAAKVWARVQDHENTHTWVDAVKHVTLEQPGTPRNGLDAIRRVAFKPLMWSTVREHIVRYEEGRTFEYKVISGMAGLNDHLGKVRVDPLGDGRSRLTWSVMFDFKLIPFGLISKSFIATFTAVLQAGLASLKQQLEA